MDILTQIKHHASHFPDRIAIVSENESLTYGQLDAYSDRLAGYLSHAYGSGKAPVVVYGHKQPLMLVCFLACAKAGRAYCPVDISVPLSRTHSIIDAAAPAVVLSVSAFDGTDEFPLLTADELTQIISSGKESYLESCRVSGLDTFYIIFTSGSTGTPKGVQIPCECLNHFLDWACDLGLPRDEKCGASFLNQAPFSFDLSVMDVYTCLACGGTLWTLSKEVQSDYRGLFSLMQKSGANVWVSTPSFADICLADKSFNRELLPELKTFLFCGETLTNRTALALLERFPDASVINTYGPTESTVALTDVTVTEELAQTTAPLPVGRTKPGSLIEIWDEHGQPLPDKTPGEIIILGNTVSTGYLGSPELTQHSFFETEREGRIVRGYHTRDRGYLDRGMLYYGGRMDLQIKLHGYRIEVEDIEQNLLKLEGIRQAAVLPNIKEEKVKSLTAYIACALPDTKETTRSLKDALRTQLPDYMIPKKFVYLERLPVTSNGKCDRKKLKEMVR